MEIISILIIPVRKKITERESFFWSQRVDMAQEHRLRLPQIQCSNGSSFKKFL